MSIHIRVKDKYRTNPLSLEPGGHTVTVKYADGNSFTYDKVKHPKAFIASLKNKGNLIEWITLDGKLFYNY